MIREEKAASDLLTAGFAVVEETDYLAELTDESLEAGRRFFALASEIKERCATPSILEGYRPLGKEYSESPDRPDLTESFSLWPRNCGRLDVLTWASSLELYEKLRTLITPFCDMAHAVLNSVGAALNPEAQAVRFQDMSYLQMNHYEPQRHKRDYLQDPHQDGHLLTLLKATEKGLEIRTNGQFRPAVLERNQILAMPGSLLTIMTGGRIQPMYHRVRTHQEIVSRQSLMFFVNPSLDVEIAPWIINASNQGIDLRQAAVTNSTLFGLPSLAEIQTKPENRKTT